MSEVIGGGNAKKNNLNGQKSDDLGGGGSKKLTEYASSLPIYALQPHILTLLLGSTYIVA